MLRLQARILGTASVAALAIGGFATPTFAQDTPANAQSCDALPAGTERDACLASYVGTEPGSAEEGAILVTGSRIRRPNLESTVPITSVGPQELTERGDLSLGDALNELPSLRSTFSQANSTRFIGTAGLSLLDLRGLGTERTLVLVNGRRHVTSTPGSYEVEVNTLPSDLVERVDVVTGGNSAIYGSDAVAGVVNFILRRDFEGIRLRAQGGATHYGDRGSYFVSGVFGHNFGDGRFNAALALEYAKQNPVFFTDREYRGAETGIGPPGFEVVEPTARLVGGVVTPVPNRNNNGVPNTRFLPFGFTFNTVSLGGMVLTVCPLATGTPGNTAQRAATCTGELAPTSGGRFSYNFAFDAQGNLVRNDPAHGLVDNRAAGGSPLFGLGASGLEGAMLLPGLERYSANLLLSGELSPAFQPFLEAKLVRVTANQTSVQPTFIASALNPIFSTTNPFLSAQARATLATITNNAAAFQMQRFNNDIGTRAEDHQRDTFRIVAGIGGDLSSSGNLRYEIAFNYGRTETYYETGGNVDIARFNRATNAVLSGGNIVCAVNADVPTANDDPACVPLNPFGFGAPSPAAINYVLYTSSRDEWAEQRNAVAFLSGDTGGFFTLPGGPIGFAIGAEYRREDAFSDYDDFTQSGATFLNSIAAFDPPAVEIKEVFGEIRLPLLRDLPFAQELSLEGAARYSDYGGSVGGVWAYNAGGTWAPVSDLRIRVGYARSVRAPNLGNLFATRSETFANALVDPCSQNVILQNPNRVRNCAAAGIPTTMFVPGLGTIPWVNTPASGVSGFNQGNPNLVPEVGRSLTAGIVFQPRFVPGFSLTIDYYKIKISNVIQGLAGQAVINRCYDDPVSIDNPFCDAVFRRRDPNPLIDFTFDGQANRIPAPGEPTLNFPVLGPAFINQPFNFAALKAEGIDFDAAYRTRIANGIVLNVRAIVSYNMNRENFTFITAPEQSTRIHGTLGDPIWAGSLSANVDFGMFDITYRANYIGPQSVDVWETQHSHQGRPPTNPDAFPFDMYPDVLYHAFRLGFEPETDFRFYMGVDNVLNRRPPYDLTGTGAGSGIFPATGRFFYAGAQVDF